jgi:molybdopterin molybdotransferase
MSPLDESLQRISRLTPLPELLKRLGSITAPVQARDSDSAAAVGATLAADIVAAAPWPAAAIALRDGWAVAADLVTDAGPYAPAPLSPPPVWVETGQPMPARTDVVLPLDAVATTKSGAEALMSSASGEGVVRAGAEIGGGAILRRAGERLRPSDVAALRAAKIMSVSIRAPRVNIFSASVPTRAAADTISPLIARAVEAQGGIAQVAQAASLESALLDRASDAIVTIGGTGSGRKDASIRTLARIGKVEAHGVGIAPGDTAAIGSANGKPVLMLPGRLDAALSVFLILGHAMLERLSAHSGGGFGARLKLTKKVTSTIGLAEVVLVRLSADGAEPIASGIFPWSALLNADGWILVPPDSEGFAAGTAVEVRSLP